MKLYTNRLRLSMKFLSFEAWNYLVVFYLERKKYYVSLLSTFTEKIPVLQDKDVVLTKSPLSRGGFGVVHRGRWKDNQVAVKIMIQHENTSKEHRKQEKINFEKEANLIYSLVHQNVVKVIITYFQMYI